MLSFSSGDCLVERPVLQDGSADVESSHQGWRLGGENLDNSIGFELDLIRHGSVRF